MWRRREEIIQKPFIYCFFLDHCLFIPAKKKIKAFSGLKNSPDESTYKTAGAEICNGYSPSTPSFVAEEIPENHVYYSQQFNFIDLGPFVHFLSKEVIIDRSFYLFYPFFDLQSSTQMKKKEISLRATK
jgi:hypothetical protein